MAIPQISIIDIIKFQRKNFSLKTENKSCYVLTCRVDGESLFFYNQQEHLIRRGDILYIPSGSSYAQKCENETLVCFHLNILGEVSSKMEVFSPKDRERVCDLFLKAEQLWKQKAPNCEWLCMSILYEIIAGIPICVDGQSERSAQILKPSMEYLDTHLCNSDFSLEKVWQQAHISRTYFNKLFQQTYGCTPTAYVNRQRVERAKQLLLSGSCSNEEIASLCGFNDVKYFYVIFKKATGLTTKAYKKEFEKFSQMADRKG